MSSVSMSSEETDHSQERNLDESSTQEPSGGMSFSSSDEINEYQQNTVTFDQVVTGAQSFYPQGHQGEFGNYAANTPMLSPPQADISLLSASATSVESSQQDLQFPSLNPVQDMGFNQRNRSSAPPANNMNTQNQLIDPSDIPEHLNLSQTMELMNQGGVPSMNQPMRSLGSSSSFGIMNNYHLPISNLPAEFRLESSSRLQLPQGQQQDLQTTPEIGDDGIPFMSKKWTNWHVQNQNTMHESPTGTRTQEIQVQGMMDQVEGQGTFYQGINTSNHHVQVPNMPIQQGMNPFGTGPTLPIHPEGFSASNQNRMQGNFVNSGQYEAGESSRRSSKMKMTWQENSNFSQSSSHQQPTWVSPSQGSLSQNNISAAQNPRANTLRSTVYDPIYEQMGLPIDPHLRMFMLRHGTGNNSGGHPRSF
ncbi:uncharacterized protein LOC133034872 [Cannabis sativa]|uniref:uncharacterized protein LOC133034872 n=1 Tax=Cannabis sativa TaxID=3483 RepID=UPI0029C9FD82|nr:uncharacterized protein LOC133034872 [Cannabis sativa]